MDPFTVLLPAEACTRTQTHADGIDQATLLRRKAILAQEFLNQTREKSWGSRRKLVLKITDAFLGDLYCQYVVNVPYRKYIIRDYIGSQHKI